MTTQSLVTVDHRFVRGRCGTLLHRQCWQTTTPPRGVIHIAHGLGDHARRHGRLAAALARAGYTVYALDHRGHGYSDGPRATIRRFHDVVADLADSVDIARTHHPESPTFLIGHSWGGLVSLAYTAQHQDNLAGLVVASTTGNAQRVPLPARMAVTALGWALPRMGTRKLPFELATRDAAAVRDFHADKLAYRGRVRAASAAQSLAAIQRLRTQLPQITVPVLLLHGTADAIAPSANSIYVNEHIGSTDRDLRLFDGLYHQLFNEPEHEAITAIVLDWLGARSWPAETLSENGAGLPPVAGVAQRIDLRATT